MTRRDSSQGMLLLVKILFETLQQRDLIWWFWKQQTRYQVFKMPRKSL